MNALQSIRLVAAREISTRAKTRSFLLTTALLMVVIIVGAIVVSLVTGGDDSKRVGVAATGSALPTALSAAGEQSGTKIAVVPVADGNAARSQVAAGDLDAAVVATGPNTFAAVSKKDMDPQLAAAIRTAVDTTVLRRALAEHDIDVRTLPHATIVSEQTTPAKPGQAQRLVIALVGTILLMIAIITGGTMVAVGVVEEKTSRVVEILLATIKPLHLLWGKIIGIGVIALLQVLVLGATALIAGRATGVLTLPTIATGMFVAVLVWFLLGFVFFASLYAATGALVSRQEELNSSSAPLTMLALAVTYAATFGASALDSPLITTLSWIPPFSASLMPMRIATGDTNAAQIILTVVIMIAACAVATWLAARIYQRSILRTGSRVKLGEALRLAR